MGRDSRIKESGVRYLIVRLQAQTELDSFADVAALALRQARVPVAWSPGVSPAFSQVDVQHSLTGLEWSAIKEAARERQV